MKITGELLRSERLRKDLNIQDIAYALKLSSKIITALEDGDLENLPSKTFIRGFVKSYAEYLKLDSSIVLKQFQEEMGSTSPTPRPPPVTVSAKPTETKSVNRTGGLTPPPGVSNNTAPTGLSLNKKNGLVFLLVALIVIAISVVNNVINKYQKETVVSQTTDDAQPLQPISADQTIAVSSDTTTPTLAVSSDVTVAANTSSLDQSASATQSQDQTTSKQEQPPAAPPAANSEKVVKYPELKPSTGKPIEVMIEGKKDTSIEYAKGNTATFQKIFIKKGAYQVLRSNSGLHLRTGDGSAIGLTVNGILKGLASPNAEPVALSY